MGKSYVYNTGEAKSPKGTINNITFSVFFDGTQNNKTNTEITAVGTNPDGTIVGNEKRSRIEEQNLRRYDKLMNPEPEPETEPSSIDPNEKTYEGVTLETVTITSTFIKEKDDSYENEYSNVARLYYAYKEEKGIKEKIYIEGVGTADRKPGEKVEIVDDQMLDVGFGVFGTSVRAKARKATNEIIKKLFETTDNGSKNIETLTIDTYGFSRGATTARYFTHLVTCNDKSEKSKYYENHDLLGEIKPIYNKVKASYDKHFVFMKNPKMSWKEKIERMPEATAAIKKEIVNQAVVFAELVNKAYQEETNLYFKQQLKENGISVENVVVRFVGLFDTVSTYGLFADNDVIDLSLNAVNRAYQTIHLSAADEYRKNFALTNIKSAGFKGISLSLPGVHCDIGGAYNDIAYEKTAFYISEISVGNKLTTSMTEGSNRFLKWLTEPHDITAFKEKLIDEGWLKREQCKPEYVWWLNDNVMSTILTGVFQNLIKVIEINHPEVIPIIYKLQMQFEDTKIGLPPWAVLYGHRKLYNGYTFIPLDIMSEFSIKAGLPVDDNYFIKMNWLIPSDLMNIHNGLIKYKDAIVNLKETLLEEQREDINDRNDRDGIFEEGFGVIEDVFTVDKQKKYLKKSKKISYLDFVDEDDLKLLRNKYLHWSAKSDKFGLEPVTRSKKIENKRKQYDG